MRFLDEAERRRDEPAFVALAAALLLAGRRDQPVFAGERQPSCQHRHQDPGERPDLWAVEVDSIRSYPSSHCSSPSSSPRRSLRGLRWRIALGAGVVVCLVMAFSRLYLGEHFPGMSWRLWLGVLIVSPSNVSSGSQRHSIRRSSPSSRSAGVSARYRRGRDREEEQRMAGVDCE